ncbi:MAG TPA: glycoside hydrolase family 6 protein [Solirubrobacteraceae bacterium]|jgi:endoglucanase
MAAWGKLLGSMRRKAPLLALPLAAATILLGLASCSSGQAKRTSSSNPLAGQLFYVEPHGEAAEQAKQWRDEGRKSDASAIERIAAQPIATWLTGSEGVGAEVKSLTTAANASGRSALLVAYDIPGRDCGSFSAGGAGSTAAYKSWIEQIASGISSRTATVILEPDAVAQTLSGCVSKREGKERYAMLKYAVKTLKAEGHVTVYIDAGNPGWIKPVSELVGPLRKAGIAHADGFALNVSNFYTTATTTAYGEELSKALGGTHFVIDTGRNGNGPDTNSKDAPTWCNPPGRALGTNPTTNTGQAQIDAYLWIKQPGASDGTCRSGAPAAGAWWPEYALELARDAGA